MGLDGGVCSGYFAGKQGLHAFQGGQNIMDALVHLSEEEGLRGGGSNRRKASPGDDTGIVLQLPERVRIPRGERQPRCLPVHRGRPAHT